MGNPSAVKLGPGLLYIAPLGTAEPTTLTGALPSAWTAIGYTEEGHEFVHEMESEGVEVAEEFYAIRQVVTGISASVNFSMAEITATNLRRALNGGTISSPTGGYVTFEPPAPGDVERVMLLWDADDDEERWLFRQCFQTGSTTIPRRKAPDKSLISVEFALEKPSGAQPFKAWFADTLA